jgi:hypothetical protein
VVCFTYGGGYIICSFPIQPYNPSDPDITPQKDFTVMIEKIPPELKSKEKLKRYFDDLFPGRKTIFAY